MSYSALFSNLAAKVKAVVDDKVVEQGLKFLDPSGPDWDGNPDALFKLQNCLEGQGIDLGIQMVYAIGCADQPYSPDLDNTELEECLKDKTFWNTDENEHA